jgi:hypothetical protein
MLATQRKKFLARQEGGSALRLTHRKEHLKGRGKVFPRYLIKCGCCGEKVEIFYGYGTLEINGVDGSVENWREILLPLLQIKKVDGEFIDFSEKAIRARKQLTALRKKYPIV